MRDGRLRVAFVLPSWGIGGTEKRFVNLYNYLSRHSCNEYFLVANRYLLERLGNCGIPLSNPDNVLVILGAGVGKWFDRPLPNLHRLIGIRMPGLNCLAHLVFQKMRCLGVRQSRGRLQAMHFDVVHYALSNLAECLALSTPKVLSCQNNNPVDIARAPFFVHALRHNGFFDMMSERIKATIIQQTGISDDYRMRVSPCSFIDYSRTYIAEKEPLVSFAGSFIRAKNPLLFVEVMCRVRSVCPGVRACMLGDGPLSDELDELIRRYDLQNVIVKRFVSGVEEVLAKSLVFLSIQDFDNYSSQALMEAMACGCAVVASDVGETWRLVTDEVGFRCPLDADAIADKVIWLLKHQDAARRMGERARVKVMTEQTIERYVSFLENLYIDAYRAQSGIA